MASSCAWTRASLLTNPCSCRTNVSFKKAGRSRLPTWSTRMKRSVEVSVDAIKNLSENLTFSMGLSGQGKSTSLEARRLLKADQRIGQAEKGQIARGELVPANDEPPIVVEPSM